MILTEKGVNTDKISIDWLFVNVKFIIEKNNYIFWVGKVELRLKGDYSN